MNKIGFRIYRFKEGPSVGLTVNEGDWTKKVVDIRDILKLYNSEDESKFAMFMSFSENGAYITIARAISGRGGDNKSLTKITEQRNQLIICRLPAKRFLQNEMLASIP